MASVKPQALQGWLSGQDPKEGRQDSASSGNLRPGNPQIMLEQSFFVGILSRLVGSLRSSL